jgi:hypothetical protein
MRGRCCDIATLNYDCPICDKSDDNSNNFFEELLQVFGQVSNFRRKFCCEILMQNGGGEFYSNQQFGMRVNIKAAMTAVLG